MTTVRSPRLRLGLALAGATLALLALVAVVLTTNADGSPGTITTNGEQLSWDVPGRATVTIRTTPVAGCDDAPCVVLSDAEGASVPSGSCVATDAGGPGVRCPTDGLRHLQVTGQPGPDNLPVAVAVDRAADQPCPAYELTIAQTASNGPVNARDGCRQLITCSSRYTGLIDGDGLDEISADCTRVDVDGSVLRRPGSQGACGDSPSNCSPGGGRGGGGSSTAGTRPVTGPSSPTDAGVPEHRGPTGRTPDGKPLISSVALERAGRRSLRTRFALGQKAQISAILFRRTPKGRWKRVASVPRPGRVGANQVLFRSSRRAPLAAGSYRATVVIALPEGKPITSRVIRKR